MGRQAPRLVLLPRQRVILERLARLRTVERRLAERVQVVLWSGEGKSSVEQADALRVDAQRVGRWRHRWNFIAYFNRLLAKPFRWTYKGRPLAV